MIRKSKKYLVRFEESVFQVQCLPAPCPALCLGPRTQLVQRLHQSRHEPCQTHQRHQWLKASFHLQHSVRDQVCNASVLLSPIKCSLHNSTINDRTLTTFYLPPGTERALHITSQTTTQVSQRVKELWVSMLTGQDVIRVLLRKFRVADNPHKYALYERQDDFRGER